MNSVELKSFIKEFFDAKEEVAIKAARKQYRERIQNELDLIEYLDKKEFKYGQIVKIVSHTGMDRLMNCTAKYGIIVGSMVYENEIKPFTKYGTNEVDYDYIEHTKQRDPYRVYQSRRNSFIGTNADSIEKVESWDEVPEELKTYEFRIYVAHGRYIPLDIKTFI